MSKTIIEAKGVIRNFESDEGVVTKVLKDVTFCVGKSDFVALMGPSGSGKSTLLHILGLLDIPTDGEYLFLGKDVRTYTDDELASLRNSEIGFVFQQFNLLTHNTVRENVELPLYYSTIPRAKWNSLVEKAIAEVGLAHRIDYMVYKLSGGEQQRVAIARALVNNPSIIFADEPTGNLDSESGKQVMEIIDKLNKESNHTVVLITHDKNIASYAHRLFKIKDGKLTTS